MPRKFGRLLATLWAAVAALGLGPGGAWAQHVVGCASCGTAGPIATSLGAKCCHTHCPPHYRHCQEGPPKIKFHQGCPKPICNPCALPHWGHYQTCWSPWPFPPDWSHCPTPPPAAAVTLNSPPTNVFGSAIPVVPGPVVTDQGGDMTLPAPRSANPGR